jgi:hypothetical protein
MIPAGLTITALLASATEVVGEFDGLIVLVVGLSLGLGLVSYIISRAKSAKRG